MTQALVLGATGHIGAHVTQALVNAGVKVRTLCRVPQRLGVLAFLDVEIMLGSVEDREVCRRALVGCQWLFHCAGYYPQFSEDKQQAITRGVASVQAVMEVAREASLERIVFTSSTSALGRVQGRLATEQDYEPWPLTRSRPLYGTVKLAMEEAARRYAREGLPIVIVNPSFCVGEYDRKPFSGKLLLMYARRELPLYLDHRFNVIYTGDVGRGHVLAAQRGRIGERYILGGYNTTLKAFTTLVAAEAGVPPPHIKIPYWMALGVGYASEVAAKLLRQPEAKIPLEAVRASAYGQHVETSKAMRELGLTLTPLQEAVRQALRWFREHGYLARR